MTFFDLSVEYPVLLTTRMEMASALPAAEDGPLSGGVAADIGIFRYKGTTLGVSAAVRGWGASWDIEPALEARVWDAAVDFGLRWSPDEYPVGAVFGWWDVGTGLRAGLFTADWWDDIATLGIGAHTGVGLVVGKGKIRPTASLRLDLSVRADRWTGTVVSAEGTSTWTYFPGSARVSALVGAELR